MFGIMDDLGNDVGKAIAIGIGTFIMTAVIIGLPILAVLSFIFNWPDSIKFALTISGIAAFAFLWSVVIDGLF